MGETARTFKEFFSGAASEKIPRGAKKCKKFTLIRREKPEESGPSAPSFS
jgi:hypothetical protein